MNDAYDALNVKTPTVEVSCGVLWDVVGYSRYYLLHHGVGQLYGGTAVYCEVLCLWGISGIIYYITESGSCMEVLQCIARCCGVFQVLSTTSRSRAAVWRCCSVL